MALPSCAAKTTIVTRPRVEAFTNTVYYRTQTGASCADHHVFPALGRVIVHTVPCDAPFPILGVVPIGGAR